MKLLIYLAISVTTVAARWARLGPSVGLYTPCPMGSCLIPIMDEGDVRDACEDLVNDGCAEAFIVGDSGQGSFAFAKRDGVSCDDAKPSSAQECLDSFKQAYGNQGTSANSCLSGTPVYNDNGDDVGHIGVTGACLRNPMGPKRETHLDWLRQ